ncbi:hypothetical protein DFH28DRAFT_910335, partial [Melampsora americana]
IKLHGMPRLIQKIRKLGDKFVKKIRRPDFVKHSNRLSSPIVPMESVGPISMHKKPSVEDYNKTPQVNSDISDESLLMEHILGDHTSNSSNSITSNAIPALSFSGTHMERESHESSLSSVKPFKRACDKVDGFEDPIITKRARISGDSYRYKEVLKLIRDLHMNVRDMLHGKVPGIDEDTPLGIKYNFVCNRMKRTLASVDYVFRELASEDQDSIMYDVADVLGL